MTETSKNNLFFKLTIFINNFFSHKINYMRFVQLVLVYIYDI